MQAEMASGVCSDAIVVDRLTKVFSAGGGVDGGDPKVAVGNVSFGIPIGEIFGFLGSNGAGKTSTLSILSGEMLATGGGARLAGYDVFTQQPQVRRLLGYW